jgi:hypothetical protein
MKHTLEDFYVENGFTITPHLRDLIATYGSVVSTPAQPTPGAKASGQAWWEKIDLKEIQFCPRPMIGIGSNDREYRVISHFLGSPVAPVGSTHRGNIDLLLTEDGRLVGVHDYLVMSWGPAGCSWRESLAAYLAGEDSTVLGNAHDSLPDE